MSALLIKLPSNILLLPTSLVLTNDFQAQYDGEGGRDCQSVPRNVCRQVAVPNCRQIADEQCRQAPTRECGKVPREQCRQIPRYNCKQVICTFASALKLERCRKKSIEALITCLCFQIPRESCQKVPKQKCERVPAQECVPVEKEECTNVPKEECRTVSEIHQPIHIFNINTILASRSHYRGSNSKTGSK